MVQLEVPVHLLLVAPQAMNRSGRTWPVISRPIISEAMQATCLQRSRPCVSLNEGLFDQSAAKVVAQFGNVQLSLDFTGGYVPALKSVVESVHQRDKANAHARRAARDLARFERLLHTFAPKHRPAPAKGAAS